MLKTGVLVEFPVNLKLSRYVAFNYFKTFIQCSAKFIQAEGAWGFKDFPDYLTEMSTGLCAHRFAAMNGHYSSFISPIKGMFYLYLYKLRKMTIRLTMKPELKEKTTYVQK